MGMNLRGQVGKGYGKVTYFDVKFRVGSGFGELREPHSPTKYSERGSIMVFLTSFLKTVK